MVAGTCESACRRPQRSVDSDRRCGLWRVRHIRRPDQYAHVRQPRAKWLALYKLPHYRNLRSHPLGALDWTQQFICARSWIFAHGDVRRISRLGRTRASHGWYDRGGPARQRLQHLRSWQVWHHTGRRGDRCWSIRSLADRQGLRSLLWLPRFADGPVSSRPGGGSSACPS